MGIPDIISTDNGTQFCSNEMEDFFKLFNIKQIWYTPYHPVAQGCVEAFNDSLENAYKSYARKKQRSGIPLYHRAYLHFVRLYIAQLGSHQTNVYLVGR